jgi:hypothetical protein
MITTLFWLWSISSPTILQIYTDTKTFSWIYLKLFNSYISTIQRLNRLDLNLFEIYLSTKILMFNAVYIINQKRNLKNRSLLWSLMALSRRQQARQMWRICSFYFLLALLPVLGCSQYALIVFRRLCHKADYS